MMLGHPNPTVHVPPWPTLDDPTAEALSPHHLTNGDYSPHHLQEAISALQHYFPSNNNSTDPDSHTCDHFRMFEFKIRRCTRGRSHDWTECPYAHPGEKARRRDPRRFHYSGSACPEFRKGGCSKGDACEHAHGVFECWLHPARYRTQACKDGLACRRRVCFFAHSPDQLRVNNTASGEYASPPDSPTAQSLASALRSLQIGSVSPVYGSPRNRTGFLGSPTGSFVNRAVWDPVYEEEPVMERVESGRGLRVRMFEKLSKENRIEPVEPEESPDLDWVSELVK